MSKLLIDDPMKTLIGPSTNIVDMENPSYPTMGGVGNSYWHGGQLAAQCSDTHGCANEAWCRGSVVCHGRAI